MIQYDKRSNEYKLEISNKILKNRESLIKLFCEERKVLFGGNRREATAVKKKYISTYKGKRNRISNAIMKLESKRI